MSSERRTRLWGYIRRTCAILAVFLVATATFAQGAYRPGGINFRLKSGYSLSDLGSVLTSYSIVLTDSVPSRQMYFRVGRS